MVTVDRSPKPNYIRQTLENLSRAGVFDSDRLHSFTIVDSGPVAEPTAMWPMSNIPSQLADKIIIESPATRRYVKANCAAALRAGSRAGAPWMLYLEDDIDACAKFLDGVGLWLDRFQRPECPVYPFSSDHMLVSQAARLGKPFWYYHVEWFWGLQAVAFRPAAAGDLADWMEAHPFYVHNDGRQDPEAHDLEIQKWAIDRGVKTFIGSAPVFVQHLGTFTSLECNPFGGARVKFPSWPGREWSYV
jgi:hypothetical protein